MSNLTHTQLAEIEARAEAVRKAVADGADQPTAADVFSAADIPALLAHVRAVEAERDTLKAAYSRLNDEVMQILGRALGYPKFVDDQVTFPGATEADGICPGDMVAEAMAEQAAVRICALVAAIKFRDDAVIEQNAEGWTNEQRIAIRCVFDWLICAAVNRDEPLRSALWNEAADMLATMTPEAARQWRDLGEYRERYRKFEAECDALRGERARLRNALADCRRLLSEARTFLENEPESQEPGSEMFTWRHQVDEELRHDD